jgi:hypothetical protein
MISPIWAPWKQIYGSFGVGDLRAAPRGAGTGLAMKKREKLA